MDEKEKILIRVKLLVSRGEHSKAKKILISSLEEYPKDAGFLIQLSITYELLGEFDKSEEFLEEALVSEPNYARAHYIKGIDLQNKGDLQGAEKEFQIAIENYTNDTDIMRNSHLSEAHNNLGTVMYLQGKQGEAIKEWRLAVSYDRNNEEARNNLADFSDESKENIEIEEDYEYLMNHGSSLLDARRTAEAIKTLSNAYSIKPDNAIINYNLGLAYGHMGNFDKSLFHLQNFLGLEPKHEEAAKIKMLVKKIKRGDFGK